MIGGRGERRRGEQITQQGQGTEPLLALQLASPTSGQGQEIAGHCARPEQESTPPECAPLLEACLATAPAFSGAGGAEGGQRPGAARLCPGPRWCAA